MHDALRAVWHMSKEEYAAILRRDGEKAKNKDFGAWGPRWNRQPAPSWADAEFLTKRMGALARPPSHVQQGVQGPPPRPLLVAGVVSVAAAVMSAFLWLSMALRLPTIVNFGTRALNAPRRLLFSQKASS